MYMTKEIKRKHETDFNNENNIWTFVRKKEEKLVLFHDEKL